MGDTHEDRMYAFLKEGGDTNPSTSTDTKDESESTVGVTHQRDTPEDREPAATITAPWGEKPPVDPQQHGTGVKEEHHKGQRELLNRAFGGKGKAEKADQAVISQNFAHGSSGDYESRAPLLQSKAKEKVSHIRTPSLMTRVRGLLGRH